MMRMLTSKNCSRGRAGWGKEACGVRCVSVGGGAVARVSGRMGHGERPPRCWHRPCARDLQAQAQAE
jgi:hypothetical protein